MEALFHRRAAGRLIGGGGLALLLAGCAAPRLSGETSSAGAPVPDDNWSGRLSLQVESNPPQSFAALFDLRGSPERGTLTLTSPIGSTLAALTWSSTEAVLRNGNETRRYESVDALLMAATGAAIPVRALFGWLAGRDERVAGWQPDLQQVPQGRLRVVRETPAPRTDLRIVFERP